MLQGFYFIFTRLAHNAFDSLWSTIMKLKASISIVNLRTHVSVIFHFKDLKIFSEIMVEGRAYFVDS